MALRLIPHEGSGQGAACLQGLVRYAQRIARTPQVGRFATEPALVDWLYAQPVKLDEGTGPTEAGCNPPQRSCVWPRDGMNCWEATAHYVGWHLAQRSNVTLHLFDIPVQGQRHVFPAVEREPGGTLQPIVLQPPVSGRPTPPRLPRGAAMAQGLRLIRTRSFDYFDSEDTRRSWLRNLVREARIEEWHEGKPPEAALALLPVGHRGIGYLARTKWGSLLYVSLRPDGWGTRYYLIEIGADLLGEESNGAPPGGGSPASGPSTPASGRLPPGAPPANGFGNDVFGGVHLVGDKLLRAFGLGSVSDSIASTAGGELPDWARTEEQRSQRAREQLEAQKQLLQKQKAEAEQREQERREKEAVALRALEEARRSRELLAQQQKDHIAMQEQLAMQQQAVQQQLAMREQRAAQESQAAQEQLAPSPHRETQPANHPLTHCIDASPPDAPANSAELSDPECPCGTTVFGPAEFTLEVIPPPAGI